MLRNLRDVSNRISTQTNNQGNMYVCISYITVEVGYLCYYMRVSVNNKDILQLL